MEAIEARGLTKRYGMGSAEASITALDELTMDVHPGEVFGFLGPNGAGKTTAIRLLLGFLHPTSGSARVLGLDVARDSVAIRARVGYLPGGVELYDSLTGDELLDFLARLSRRPPVRRAELTDRLELPAATLRRRIRDYSRGMRQKLGIVQALQHDPELAILDEPSEGLDPLMQRAFYAVVDDLRSAGRTVFLSSHILSEVERICDRVAIVRGGRLVELAGIEALRSRRRRNVEMRLAGPPPRLDAIAGVSDVATGDGRLTCRVEGDMTAFLAAIRDAPIVDLVIEPARLEEAFLAYYESDLHDPGDPPAPARAEASDALR